MPRMKYKKRPDGRYQTKIYIGAEDGNLYVEFQK